MRETIKTKKSMMNLIRLDSVGSVFDTSDLQVYPQLVDGLPDLGMGISLVEDEVSAEWYGELSSEDYDKVKHYL